MVDILISVSLFLEGKVELSCKCKAGRTQT